MTLAPVGPMSNTQPSLSVVVAELVEMLASGALEPGYSAPIRRGSAQGTVAVVPSPAHRIPLLVITLEIMRAPADASSAFLTRLLELNGTLMGRAAFSLNDAGLVYLQAGRPIEDLDEGELIDLIIWTADQADHLDDLLLEEFGREHEL